MSRNKDLSQARQIRLPVRYVSREGGIWKKWPGGPVPKSALAVKGARHCIINKYVVHALEFVSGQKWDTINGFRSDDHAPPAYII